VKLTRELLLERMKAMEVQRAQFIANANGCEGALKMLQQLLTDLDSEEPQIASDTGTGTEARPLDEGGMYNV